MSALVGEHGLAGCGKTTLAEYLKTLREVKEYAFAWPLKRVCGELYKLSWEQMNDPQLKETPIPRLNNCTPRYILQRFGTELVRKHHKEALPDLPYESLWLDLGKEWIRENKESFRLISDARFENEIAAIKEASGYVLGIERLACAATAGTHPSAQVLFHLCDGVVTNNGTLAEFQRKIAELFSPDEAVRDLARRRAAAECIPATTRAEMYRLRALIKELHDRLYLLRHCDSELRVQYDEDELLAQVSYTELYLHELEQQLPEQEAAVLAVV